MLCNRALFRHGLYEVRVLALPLEALGFGGSPLCDFFFGSGTAAGAVADIVEVPKCGCLEITVCHIWIGKTGLFLIPPALLPFTQKQGAGPGACPKQSPFTGFRAM
jgi:hypothetical protein